jgi:Ca2+-transporting ATPase
VLAIISLILVNRSFGGSVISAFRRPNPAFAMVLVTVVIALGLTLIWPFAKDLFRFGPLHADDLAITVVAGLLVLLVLEAVKPIWRKRLLA